MHKYNTNDLSLLRPVEAYIFPRVAFDTLQALCKVFTLL